MVTLLHKYPNKTTVYHHTACNYIIFIIDFVQSIYHRAMIAFPSLLFFLTYKCTFLCIEGFKMTFHRNLPKINRDNKQVNVDEK